MSAINTVGEQQLASGTGIDGANRVGAYGEAIQSINGEFFEHTLRGRMFTYGISSQALLIATNGTGFPTIFNPQGSNLIFVPVAIRLSFISGTTVIGGLNWHVTLNCGAASNIGTGLPLATFTHVAPTNCAPGSTTARSSGMRFAPTTVTFTATPTFLAATGISVGAVAPTNGGGPFPTNEDGKLVIFPGTALSLCYTVTTSTALFATTIYGLELPLPAGM